MDRFEAARRRRKIRQQAIALLGGVCDICGYSGCPAAFDFHHTDPMEKDFSISDRMTSLEAIRSELAKCVLLCARCHREVHDGWHPTYLEREDRSADLDLLPLFVEGSGEAVLAADTAPEEVLTLASGGLVGSVDADHVGPTVASLDEEDVGGAVTRSDIRDQGNRALDASLEGGILLDPDLGEGSDDGGGGGGHSGFLGGGFDSTREYTGQDQTDLEDFFSLFSSPVGG